MFPPNQGNSPSLLDARRGFWRSLTLAVTMAAVQLVAQPAGEARAVAGTHANVAYAPPKISARSAIVVDGQTGQTLLSRKANRRRPVASITKVMTALVVLRAGYLDRTITVKKKYVRHVRNNGFSSARLHAGDRLTVRQLLYATLVPSGCDAAYALADQHGGRRFVARMNTMARRLGMRRTRFSNYDGVPSRARAFSTPRDLMLLARHAMADSTFREIAKTGRYRLRKNNKHHAYLWRSTNGLLGSSRGTLGIKTGYTRAAGYCLLFAARRGGRILLGAVLGSTSLRRRVSDSRKLLNWGFSNAPPGNESKPFRR